MPEIDNRYGLAARDSDLTGHVTTYDERNKKRNIE